MKNISKLFLEEKKKLEEEQKKKLEEEQKKFEKSLISIMSEGAKEFKEKTGRCMTYSEMREMYG